MNQLFNYIAIIIFILLIAVMAFLYLRHRLITRYRDLGIIFFLLLLLFIGFQVTDMEKSTTQQSQTTQMIPFIKAVARDHNVSPQKVVVNSTTLTHGVKCGFKLSFYGGLKMYDLGGLGIDRCQSI